MSRPSLRPDLADLEGYHSPQVEAAVRLNTNESPYPVPDEYRDALVQAVCETPLHRYPDRGATALRAATAAFLGQPAERVFCANGSNEILQTLLLAYGGVGRSAAVFRPTYLLHEQIARVTGTDVVGGVRAADYTLDLDEVRRVCDEHRPDVTFLCSPNNPTGTIDPRASLEAVLDAAPGLVVVDEAYGEFASQSALDLVGDGSSLVVVRTFSKAWSLAGVRIGCCVAPPDVVADLERLVLPYHLSALTQAAGTLALQFAGSMRERVDALVSERERVSGALHDIDGVQPFPSGANFVLFRVDDAPAAWHGLLARGVLVRDCSSWGGLEGCLRVTIGTPGENDLFLEALRGTLS